MNLIRKSKRIIFLLGFTDSLKVGDKTMKKINKLVSSICISLLLISNPLFASYHTEEVTGKSNSGGGYGSGGSALALIAVYAVSYAIYKNTRDEDDEATYMFSKRTEPGFEVSLNTQKNRYQSFNDHNASGLKFNDSSAQTTLNVYYRFK